MEVGAGETAEKHIRRPHSKHWDSLFPFPAVSSKLSSLIVFLVGVAVFLNSVDGLFVFDDSEAVVNNRDVLVESPITNIIYNDFWGTPLIHNRSHKSYRPITILTFRLNVWLAGGVHPYGFHLTNILLHGIVSSLAVPVSNDLFGGCAPRMSLLTSLLFAVHPVHTEAVAGIVGRADLLCALFSFLSFLAYVNATKHSSPTIVVSCLLSSIFFCSLALFSKEQGITVLGVCLAYDLLICHKINIYCIPFYAVTRLRRWFFKKLTSSDGQMLYNDEPEDSQVSLRKPLVFRMSVLFLTGVALLFTRWQAMGGTQPIFQQVDNPASFDENLLTRVWSYNYLYSLNGWLLLCPEWLCFDWSMGCVPLLSSSSDPRLLAVLTFWVSLLGLTWRGFRSASCQTGRSVNMAVAVAVITFLPASNLFFRVGFVLAERVLYLPSLGFCMLVVLGMQIILSRTEFKKTVTVVFLCMLLLFAVRSVQRSREWLDERTLFHSALSVCPLNAKVHYNVAKNAGDMGDQKLAVNEYKIALQLHPEYDQAMNNLANILREAGNLGEAESLLRKALSIRPDFAAAWMNLGIVLAGLKEYKEAELSYSTALSHRTQYPECLYNLGNLYLNLKLYREALRVFRKAVQQRPLFSIAWNNMVIMLESTGNLGEAKVVAYEGLEVIPNDPGLHFNLANTLGKMNLFIDAETHFRKAIHFSPNNAIYHSNLGVLYHRWKKYDLAEAKYNDALNLDPHLKSAGSNLAMLKRSKETIVN